MVPPLLRSVFSSPLVLPNVQLSLLAPHHSQQISILAVLHTTAMLAQPETGYTKLPHIAILLVETETLKKDIIQNKEHSPVQQYGLGLMQE